MPDPPQPSRFSTFQAPLNSFRASFPAWTKVPASDPDMTAPRRTTLEPLFHHRNVPQGPIRRDPDSDSSHPSIIRTASVDSPTLPSHQKLPSQLVQKAVHQLQEDKARQMLREDYPTTRQPDVERRVSFNNSAGHESVQFHRGHN